jgi:hypothetical protein
MKMQPYNLLTKFTKIYVKIIKGTKALENFLGTVFFIKLFDARFEKVVTFLLKSMKPLKYPALSFT